MSPRRVRSGSDSRFAHRFRGCAAVACLLFGSSFGRSQAASAFDLLVAVADDHGQPAAGLGRSDFAVRIEGGNATVVSVARAVQPPTIVFAVDGFSVQQGLAVKGALASALESWRRGGIGGRVGGVAETVDATVQLMTSVSSPNISLDSLRSRLPMPNALEVALQALGRESTTRRAIMVITSGSPTVPATADQIRGQLRSAKTQLWNIVVQATATEPNASATQNPSDLADADRFMAELVRDSGGAREAIFGTAGLSDCLNRMMGLLLSEYDVRVSTTSNRAVDFQPQVEVKRAGFKAFAARWPVAGPL